MKIPVTGRKKALIIVDVEPDFIRASDEPIVQNIRTLLARMPYDAYIEAVFGTENNTLWAKETGWSFPLEETRNDVRDLIPEKHLHVIKNTKSVFKGDQDVVSFLKNQGIEEVHVIGFDINDCVLTTAQEAFDLGFFTYVIEECSGSSESDNLKDAAIAILRENEMTNHTTMEDMAFRTIE